MDEGQARQRLKNVPIMKATFQNDFSLFQMMSAFAFKILPVIVALNSN